MKTLLSALILTVATATAAHADSITITIDKPTQTAASGQTISFFGTIINTSSAVIFLNGDDFNLTGNSFTLNDQFLNNVPISLAPGASSGDIELFDYIAASPLPVATYTGSYALSGGADGNAQDILSSANFALTPAVTPVPEPSSIYLLLGGISSAMLPIARRIKELTA